MLDVGSHSLVHAEAPNLEPQTSTPSSRVSEMTASSVQASATVSHEVGGSGSDAARVQAIAEEAGRLQDRFATIVTHMTISFVKKEKVSSEFFDTFSITLTNLPLSNKHKHLKFLEKEEDRINTAKNVREILNILRPYWNYRDYAFLERILNEFGTSELQEEMKTYIADLEDFEKRSVKDYNSAALDEIPIPGHFEELPLEYLKDPAQCSLYGVRQLVNRIVNRSTLTGYSVLVKSLSCNSIKIVLAFPPEAYAELSEVLDEQFMKTLVRPFAPLGDHTQLYILTSFYM